MDDILDEVRGTLDAGFTYAAIMLALALPDICASLSAPDDRGTTRQSALMYKDWFNAHLSMRFTSLTAEDCYSLRCGVVHQGRMGNVKRAFTRAFFYERKEGGRINQMTFTNCVINDVQYERVIGFDAEFFVASFIEAVREWFEVNKDSADVSRNVAGLVRRHPDGLAPFFSGRPVVA